MLKKIFLFLLTVLLLAAFWQHELIWYGVKQAQGQLRIVRNAVEIKEVMQNASFPDSLKKKIEVIQDARKFAVDQLGLKDTDNYTTFYDQKGETALWNVSACMPYSFEPKTWWFPVVGVMPYKGFFDKKKAEQLATNLRKEDWDVRIRPVNGWSTLGWFKDPILSSMLGRSEGQLAELIIHELTHGTIFVKDQVIFNENLASFVGEHGARQFLSERYGYNSNELADYLSREEDSRRFTSHVLSGTKKLDSLFHSFNSSLSVEVKQHQKETLISEICERIDTIQFLNDRFSRIFSNRKPNNAYFMSFLRYYSASDSLTVIWQEQYDADLKLFVKGFIEQYGTSF